MGELLLISNPTSVFLLPLDPIILVFSISLYKQEKLLPHDFLICSLFALSALALCPHGLLHYFHLSYLLKHHFISNTIHVHSSQNYFLNLHSIPCSLFSSPALINILCTIYFTYLFLSPRSRIFILFISIFWGV